MPYSIDSSSDRCYPGTSCLMNKFDIRDAQKLDELESSIVYGKLALLQHVPITGSFDFAHYKRIHQFLFCDLYDWAGQIRDVDLFKKGTAFVPASDIEQCADALFGRLQTFRPENLSRREIIENIADFYNTLNMLHPFREGNGRTQRVFFTQWVTQKLGWHLDLVATNPDELMIATIYAAQGVMDYLIDCFAGALQIPEIDSGIQMDLL